MNSLGTPSRPLRVAIVGSGPAGMYSASAIQKAEIRSRIDIFEALPVPYGLVRSGVAPDHSKIKKVTNQFEKIFQKDNCFFWGNVKVGRDISIEKLRIFYDAVILAHGAESDRSLGILGEDLPGSYAATQFVGWYNAHPAYKDLAFNLSTKNIAIIGQGNVAVDVLRILAKPASALAKTDIASHALKVLEKSQVENIYMIGRRGPVQAAFTDKELKELGEIENCDVLVSKKDLELDEIGERELEQANKVSRKNYSILKEFSEKQAKGAKRKIHIVFYKSPSKILGIDSVTSLQLETTTLVGEPGARKANRTGSFSQIPCEIVFRSVGYRGLGLPGVSFDENKAVYPNDKGRVLFGGAPELGLYTSGWIKRGPSGVIGTNKADANETVETLLNDLGSGKLEASQAVEGQIARFFKEKSHRIVSYEDWLKIDASEIEKGQVLSKEREKMISIEDVIKLLDS